MRTERELPPPHTVFFDWEIIHSCPYKCEYCWFTRAGWEKFVPDSALPSFEAALAAWRRMHELYGTCHINITGGEPALFPRFFELAAELARLHTLELQTSLCFDPEELIRRVPPMRVRIAATFHPSKEKAEMFIAKAAKLRHAGFDLYCNFLGHPSQLEQEAELRVKFSEADLPFYTQPYAPPPSGASAKAEKPITPAPPEQKLCRMGQMYGKILPDGRAFRCRTVAYEKDVEAPFYLGNFFASDFALHKEPLPCGIECRCEPMPVGGEAPWTARARENSRAGVRLGWDLCYECNYRCPYCQGWSRKKAVPRTVLEWGAIWERLYMCYGPCHIFVSGGEPSRHPDFVPLMLQTARLHEIDICTNFSWEPELLTAKLSPRSLSISATFHPDFADFNEFLARAVRAKAYLAHGKIYTVASPKHMDKLPERVAACEKHGIKLQVMPLRGVEGAPPCSPSEDGAAQQENAQAPQSPATPPPLRVLNDEAQKETIQKLAPAGKRELGFRLGKESPKGKLCRAGFRYAIIRASGKVDRCSQCETGELGDIASPDFHLLDSPKPCELDFCPIESEWLE